MATLCNQLLLQSSVYPFNTLQVCYRHIEDEHEDSNNEKNFFF